MKKRGKEENQEKKREEKVRKMRKEKQKRGAGYSLPYFYFMSEAK